MMGNEEVGAGLWDVSVYPNAPGLLVVQLYEVLCWRDFWGRVHRVTSHPPMVTPGVMPETAVGLAALVACVKGRLVANCYAPYDEVRECWWEEPKAEGGRQKDE